MLSVEKVLTSAAGRSCVCVCAREKEKKKRKGAA